jgi:signal transduction histidine kinase
LLANIDHIKEIVATQQNYARVAGITEDLPAAELLDAALRMNSAALQRHGVIIQRRFQEVPPVRVDKHKVLQILINLLGNARHAMDEAGMENKLLILGIIQDQGAVKISISDNGVGIAAENLTRIFRHGFTTKPDGHGFGLHSGALAAKEMGGALRAYSDGPGKGATFILQLPLADSNSEHHE